MLAPYEANSKYVQFTSELQKLADKQPHLSAEEMERRSMVRRRILKNHRSWTKELYDERFKAINADRRKAVREAARHTALTMADALMNPSTPPSVQEFKEELEFTSQVLKEAPSAALSAELAGILQDVRAEESQRGGGCDRRALQELQTLSVQVLKHAGEEFCPFEYAEDSFLRTVKTQAREWRESYEAERIMQYLRQMFEGEDTNDAGIQIPFSDIVRHRERDDDDDDDDNDNDDGDSDDDDDDGDDDDVKKLENWVEGVEYEARALLVKFTKRAGPCSEAAAAVAAEPAPSAAQETKTEQPAASAASV